MEQDDMSTNTFTWKGWARWLATFVGFPVGGFAARMLAGPVDDPTAAIASGLVVGVVLGAVQVGIGGIEPGGRTRWVTATATGMAVGLGLGARIVGFDTDTASLVAMGAISGAAVGVAQALSAPWRTTARIQWILATPTLWAIGWLISANVIVDAESQHAIFGSSGAIVVSAAAGLLPAIQQRQSQVAIATAGAPIPSTVAR
jgi:hypothetical protein